MAVTDTPLDLDAIEARANATTDGPWTAHEFGSYSDHEPTSIVVMQGDGPDWWQSADDGDYIARLGWDRQEWDDAEFIAHARTDVPALVAALRKAEARVARMSLLTTAELVYVSSGELTARAEKAEARVAAVLALHAPHGRLDDLHCAQHDPGSYPCATARAAGAS